MIYDERLHVVQEAVATVTGAPSQPAPGANLALDLGVTSFDMMVLCVELEQRLGTSCDVGRLRGVATVEDLARAWE